MFPKQRRDEVFNLKKRLASYSKVKEKCMFLSKRDRQIRNGWRDGILGVSDVE